MNELKELAQLGGTVFTVLAFLLYLQKKDELSKKTYEEFNTTINNHLDHSNRIIEENSKALRSVSVNLKELSIFIKRLNGKRKKSISV